LQLRAAFQQEFRTNKQWQWMYACGQRVLFYGYVILLSRELGLGGFACGCQVCGLPTSSVQSIDLIQSQRQPFLSGHGNQCRNHTDNTNEDGHLHPLVTLITSKRGCDNWDETTRDCETNLSSKSQAGDTHRGWEHFCVERWPHGITH